jgi:hypothetical protein
VIWGSAYGPYGHIAICTEANVNNFKCFSQNDPIGSLSGYKTYSNYNGVLGWLHPKQSTPTPPVDCSAITAERDRLNGVITGKDETISHLGDTITAKNAELASLNTTISSLNSQVLTLTEQLATATEQAKKVPELTNLLNNCDITKQGYAADLSKCQTQVGKIKAALIPKRYLSLKIYNALMALE